VPPWALSLASGPKSAVLLFRPVAISKSIGFCVGVISGRYRLACAARVGAPFRRMINSIRKYLANLLRLQLLCALIATDEVVKHSVFRPRRGFGMSFTP
jgi:hypothetical protein